LITPAPRRLPEPAAAGAAQPRPAGWTRLQRAGNCAPAGRRRGGRSGSGAGV